MFTREKGGKMKKLFIITMILLIALPVMAKEVTLQFAWDANSEPDMAGYALFARQEGQAYDYNNPLDPPCIIVNGLCYVDQVAETCEFEYTFNAPDGIVSTFYFVARARDIYSNWSGDSNEISAVFDLAPIAAPTMLIGVYNDSTQTVDFTWSQPDVERTVRWRLYMKQGTDDFTEVGELVKTPEMTGPLYTISWNVPGDGTYEFATVAFTEEWVASENSNLTIVTVKKSPSPVHNFRVKIRIK